MSWEHGTFGWEGYENFTRCLEAAGIKCAEELKAEVFVRGSDSNCQCYCGYDPENPDESCPCCRGTCDHCQHLRLARFTTTEGIPMVVEEYLAVRDYDCDGSDLINIVIYREGERLLPETRVVNLYLEFQSSEGDQLN